MKRNSEKGFTLIEILVVVAILGAVSGVTTLSVGKFIGSGAQEAKNAEMHQVQTAAISYLVDGNTISEPFTVSPGNQGVLDPYLIGALAHSWLINTDGSVAEGKEGNGGGGGKKEKEKEKEKKRKILVRTTFDDKEGLKPLMGDWYVEDGVLKPSPDGKEQQLVLDAGPWTNFEATVDATLKEGKGYGVYYRCNDDPKITGYIFQYDPGLGNCFAVRKVIDGREFPQFQQVKMSKVMGTAGKASTVSKSVAGKSSKSAKEAGDKWVKENINGTHTIAISVEGAHHVITVDGVEVFNFEDDSFSRGTVGFRTWSEGDVEFDDVVVTEL